MLIRKLKLVNFRSWKKIELEFNSETNIIWGLNASGKTNILEAIAAVSLGKNIRGEYESEVIRQGKEAGIVEARIERNGEIVRLRYSIGKTEYGRVSKKFAVNGVQKPDMHLWVIWRLFILDQRNWIWLLDRLGKEGNFWIQHCRYLAVNMLRIFWNMPKW